MRQQVLSIVVPWRDATDLQVVLAALQYIDMYQIDRYKLRPLYSIGAKYKSLLGAARCKTDAPESCERFLSALALNDERFGDCKDFAAYLAAQRRLEGDQGARTLISNSKLGYHVRTLRGDGRIEDPSIVLGMTPQPG